MDLLNITNRAHEFCKEVDKGNLQCLKLGN